MIGTYFGETSTMKLTSALVLSLAAACGSSPPPPTPLVPPVDPVPMTQPSAEPAAPPAATEPVPPPDPATPDPAQVKAELLAAEAAAFERAHPVFDAHCARCHTKRGRKASAGKLKHFDMTSYPFGGHHAMAIAAEVREVLGLTGKKPSMPADKKGAVKGDELAAIAAWADAFDAAHAGGAHDGHGGDGGHGGHGH